MIPLAVPNLAGREAEYLQECIDSTFVSSVGPFVDRFESMVAGSAGTAGSVAVSAGTTGLHLVLHAIGVGPGDLVALPSLTFVASANAIAHCGADPWLFDVAEESWTLDPEQLLDAFRRDLTPGERGPIRRDTGRRVAAILPVHTLGHPADLDAIAGIGRGFGVPVVADAAAAMGARYRGRAIGEAQVAASVFSFNGNKTVTAGGGGAVASDDRDLLARLRHLSTTARVGSEYDHDEVGFNYRMTNLQAAVGCAQLEQLAGFVERKRWVQSAYSAAFSGSSGVASFPEADWARSACWFAGAFLHGWEPEAITQLREDLREDGIDARAFWKPMHLQRPYRHCPVEPQPVAERVWPRILTLPCSTSITDAEVAQVVVSVRSRLSRP